jgi:cytochrome c
LAAAASLAAALTHLPPPVAAEEMAARGRAVFEARCASCHASLEAGREGLPGPRLADLLGRGVAGDPAFDYSPALEAARGRAWDAATLDRFLADPEAMFPGLWMGENGVRDAADRAAVVRFLTGGG